MQAARDHVDHRQGQGGTVERRRSPAPPGPFVPEAVEVDEQLLAAGRGRRVRHGERDAEQGVGPQPALVGRAVERDQPGVESRLVVEVDPRDRRGDQPGDVVDGLEDAQAAVSRALGIAQLERLVPARAGPRGDDRPADGPVESRSPRPPRSAARASRAPAAPSVPSMWPCRSLPPSPRENRCMNRPRSRARPRAPGGRTSAPAPGLARRGTRPGSCRRPGPGSRPPCAGWPGGSARPCASGPSARRSR